MGMMTRLFNRLNGEVRDKDANPEKERNIFIEETRQSMQKIVKKSREDNKETLNILQDNGMKLVDITDEARNTYREAGIETQNRLAGKLYSEDILQRVLQLLEEYRSDSTNQ